MVGHALVPRQAVCSVLAALLRVRRVQSKALAVLQPRHTSLHLTPQCWPFIRPKYACISHPKAGNVAP